QKPLATTLLFDARRRQNRQFTWQISDADSMGRSVWRFESSWVESTAKLFEINSQGRIMSQRPLAVHEIVALQERIFGLANSPETAASVAVLRAQKLQAEQALAIYSVMEVYRHNMRKLGSFKTELENRQDAVDKIGFMPSQLYRSPAELIGHITAPYA
ncbi:MAG: hypothetical protein ACREGF_01710, partial [Candidatus Saccharimonadales bacterium]